MPVPSVSVTKNPFALPALPPSSDGVLAILASSQTALSNIGSYSNPGTLFTAAGYGPMTEYGAYDMNVSGRPVVAVPSTASHAATYGTITKTIAGTGVPVAGATAPLEHYGVIVTCITAATLGTSGVFQVSLDNGANLLPPISIGTSLTLTIPNSGVSFTLGTSGQTYAVGDTFSCWTERALMADTDITTALNLLALSRLPWEMALIDSAFQTGTTVGLCDTWLSGLEATGHFKIILLNTRFKNEPQPTQESEASYATAITTTLGTQTSNRILVGADGGHVPSLLTGYNLKRPTSLFAAARAMSLTPNIGKSPSYVSDGPLTGVTISDANGNPYDHDEELYPNLDSLSFATLRSFAPGGPQGVYLTHPNIISASNSSIRYLQQLRVLNKACTIAWSVLVGQIQLGVRSQVNQNTGALNIAEIDAQKIEALVNTQLVPTLQGQVTGALFSLSRDDNLLANPVILTGQVAVQALVYVDGFAVQVALVKNIAAST